jgi:hypothetical protein
MITAEGVTDAKVSEQNVEHQSSMFLGDTKSTQWDPEVKKVGMKKRW